MAERDGVLPRLPREALAGSRPYIGAFAGPRRMPDFQHLAGAWIEETLAGETPVSSRRIVERPSLVAAAPEEEPDQKERNEDPDGQEKPHHGIGSITAAVP
jgi:hypothetical protein